MSDKEWQDLRSRIKRLNQEWEKCACPKRCKADSLDEQSKYDRASHVKSFLGAKFICRGCHWLKTPPLRIKTWLDMEGGVLPPLTSPPHIIECLGWTEGQVNELKARDLAEQELQVQDLGKIHDEVQAGKAIALPWQVNLSNLREYGYTQLEVTTLEGRMMTLAMQRLWQH